MLHFPVYVLQIIVTWAVTLKMWAVQTYPHWLGMKALSHHPLIVFFTVLLTTSCLQVYYIFKVLSEHYLKYDDDVTILIVQ